MIKPDQLQKLIKHVSATLFDDEVEKEPLVITQEEVFVKLSETGYTYSHIERNYALWLKPYKADSIIMVYVGLQHAYFCFASTDKREYGLYSGGGPITFNDLLRYIYVDPETCKFI